MLTYDAWKTATPPEYERDEPPIYGWCSACRTFVDRCSDPRAHAPRRARS